VTTVSSSVAEQPRLASPVPSGLRKESAWRRKDRLWGYFFVGPQLIGMAVFVLVPFAGSLILAFASWDGLTELTWVGLDNFVSQFQDPLLLRSILNTLLIALITVPIGLGFSVVIAVALEKLKTRTLYLVLFFAPVVTSTVAVAMIWQQMLRSDGVVSDLVSKTFGIAPPDWLGDPKLALISVCIVSIWASMGTQRHNFPGRPAEHLGVGHRGGQARRGGCVHPVLARADAPALAHYLLLVSDRIH
jgi:multiple sugar transport system permease protein